MTEDCRVPNSIPHSESRIPRFEIMSFKATHRYARISPRKVRPLADLVRGKFADEALDILRYQPQRGARMLEKVIRSAMGNAQENAERPVNIENLVVVDCRVDGGPMFKRVRPRARGMAFMVLRRMSHIQVTLEDLNELENN
jgi:large subunit ribosomal protein L22